MPNSGAKRLSRDAILVRQPSKLYRTQKIKTFTMDYRRDMVG
jgi:hypothetical protein